MKRIGALLRDVATLSPDELSAHLEARWVVWKCAACRAELSARRDLAPGPGRLCSACEGAERRPAVPAPWSEPEGRAERLEAAGVPAAFARAEFRQPARWPAILKHEGVDLGGWQLTPWCVLVSGATGAGKTMLATELFWRNLDRAKSPAWMRASLAIRELFGAFGEERARAAALALYESDLLLLDEIGRGHDGVAWTTIVEVLAARHQAQLPTLLTTNRRIGKATKGDREQGLSEYDPSLFRRLQEGWVVGMMEGWKPAV